MYDYVLLSATISETIQELESAVGSFMPSNSAHEGYALLLQQVDELKEEVWKSPNNRNLKVMRHEAIQVAAMAMRFLLDSTEENCDDLYQLLAAIISGILEEFQSAVSCFAPFNSAHEGYAVLLEEVDELKEEVWKSPKNRNQEAMRREATQVGAMAFRFLMDCTVEDEDDLWKERTI